MVDVQVNAGKRDLKPEELIATGDEGPFRSAEGPAYYAVSLGAAPSGLYARFGKRLLDIAIALVALSLLLPVMIGVAVVVFLSDGAPIIYRQARAGRRLEPFLIAKFRTMYRNMPAPAGSWKKSDPRPNGAPIPQDQPAVDPRIFWGGRGLRKYSLDELPQFWNVLKGEMSVVGPRPLLCSQVEDNYAMLADVIKQRAAVRPGITGFWQVSGRSDVTFDRMMLLDLEYVRDLSLRKDLAILFKTVAVVVLGAGAE